MVSVVRITVTLVSKVMTIQSSLSTDVSVQLHGSSASQFATVTSDVNINLDIPAAQDLQVLVYL